MKYFINKPRILKSGKRAEYWGCRVECENAYEEQAKAQLYPDMGKAPKGRKTEKETAAWLDQVRAAVERRAHHLAMDLPVGDTKPIAERIAEYIAWGKLKGGRKGLPWGDGHAEHQETYLRFWVAELGLKTLSDIRQGPFNQAVTRLAQKQAGNTVNNKAFALTGICTWATASAYLLRSPISFKALDDTPVNPRGAFTLDELRDLFRASEWSIVYRTAYYLRFRRNECDSLKVNSVLWADGLMDLNFRSAKDRLRALKPIPPRLLADLWAHCEGRDGEERLFTGWTKRMAADRIHADMGRLGIPIMMNGKRRDFHSLGHSTATSMDRHKVAPGLAQKFMRHKSWAETQGYIDHEVEAERVVSRSLEEEVEHTDDALEERMSLKSDGVTTYEHGAGSLSPSATDRAAHPVAGKIAKFRKVPRAPRKAAAVPFAKYQELAAHLRHALFADGKAGDIEAFLKLSPKDRAALMAGRKQGAA